MDGHSTDPLGLCSIRMSQERNWGLPSRKKVFSTLLKARHRGFARPSFFHSHGFSEPGNSSRGDTSSFHDHLAGCV